MPRKRKELKNRRGFTLIELLIVIAIILTIIMIALPKVSSLLMNAREVAVIKEIQTLHTAQMQYQSQFHRFATKLEELGPPASGHAGPDGADIIPGELAKGTKSGYNFVLQGNGTSYVINANPVSYNNTGRRTFFSDMSNTIHENWGPEPATLNSPELK